MKKLFGKGKNKYSEAELAQTKYKMIRRESDLVGSQLFGVIPEGHVREFYCLDEHTWVWSEEWEKGGTKQKRVIRYELGENNVIKNIDGVYKKIGEVELKNLRQAIRVYYAEVMKNIYKIDPYTGQAL